MSAISFWIWPSLNGDSSSAGASTREIWRRGRARQRTAAQIVAGHMQERSARGSHDIPASTSPGTCWARRCGSWAQARDHRGPRPTTAARPDSPPGSGSAAGGALRAKQGPAGGQSVRLHTRQVPRFSGVPVQQAGADNVAAAGYDVRTLALSPPRNIVPACVPCWGWLFACYTRVRNVTVIVFDHLFNRRRTRVYGSV